MRIPSEGGQGIWPARKWPLLGDRREEPRRWPALFVGTGGEVWPQAADGGERAAARQPGGIDLDLFHATSSGMLPSSAS
jgi:hypothetical protein